MLLQPRAVLFDLDATLVDTDAAAAAGVRAAGALAATLFDVDPARWAEANSQAFAEVWARIEADWVAGRARSTELSRAVGLRTLALTGGSEKFESQLSNAFREGMHAAATPFPDVLPLLDSLAAAGIMTGVITNSVPDAQRAMLRALGIEDRFHAVVISGEHGVAKPDPEIFDIALGLLGVHASEAWHIGDNPATDVAGALAAGVSGVWLNRHGRTRRADEPIADAEIRTLTELVTHVEKD